ncbi:hypothetical protein D3C80_839740 [compost metagenome]
MTTDIFGNFALEQVRGAAGELHHLQAAHNLAHGIGMHFAVFSADNRRESLGILFQQFLEAAQDPGATQWRGCRPCREGGLGGGNRFVQLLGAGQRNPGAQLSCGWVAYFVEATTAAFAALAIDVVLQGNHRFSPGEQSRSGRSNAG